MFDRANSKRDHWYALLEVSLSSKTYFRYDQLNSRTSIGAPGRHFHHETFETLQHEFCSLHHPGNRHFLVIQRKAFLSVHSFVSHFGHFMREKQWQCQSGDIVFAAFFQNIP